MSAANAFSLLNETEGSDTSYRTIHLTRHLHLTQGMAWTETLKEDFGVETDTIPVIQEVQEVVPTVVEEKPASKKSKKSKKPQPKKVVEEDLDSILKEMGLEVQEEEKNEESTNKMEEGTRKKMNKKTVSKAAAIIANESAQRKNKKKSKK
ncbi:hypothetical protein WA171_000183 [Blastocystis sp. BT1]